MAATIGDTVIAGLGQTFPNTAVRVRLRTLYQEIVWLPALFDQIRHPNRHASTACPRLRTPGGIAVFGLHFAPLQLALMASIQSELNVDRVQLKLFQDCSKLLDTRFFCTFEFVGLRLQFSNPASNYLE
jgi:hypothetical protein